MFKSEMYPPIKKDAYMLLIAQLKSLCMDVTNDITLLANASALLKAFMHDINWVGFYIFDCGSLCLGPFQGKVACCTIPIGKGLCGSAFESNTIIRVDNVLEYPNHIACDSESKSEIVIPIRLNNSLYGVLDIDAPIFSRFDEEDQLYLELFVETLATFL